MRKLEKQTLATMSVLTPVENDIIKRLEGTTTAQDLIDFYIDCIANKSKDIKALAVEFGIKSGWAYASRTIGQKLMFQRIDKIKLIKNTKQLQSI
jgi:hypothetical protein